MNIQLDKRVTKIPCLIIFFAVALTANAQIFLPATYGAKGDGKTDDTKALLACFGAAVKQKNSIVDLGSSTYLCNLLSPDGSILSINGTFSEGLTVIGEGTTIRTSVDSPSMLLYAYAFAQGSNLRISGISFINTHPLTTNPTTCIFIQGTGGMLWKKVTIDGCTFNGFNTAIGAQGVTGLTVSANIFRSDRGHDDAEQNTTPAAFIWLFDNSNGYCDSVTITGNIANGYTGAGISTTTMHRPMDNFVFGVAYHSRITDNQTTNFGEEHYFLHPATRPIGNTTYIAHNQLDCSIPLESVQRSNYGIRVDDNNVMISQNNITNYTWGIMVRAMDYTGTAFVNYKIDGNDLSQATDTSYSPQGGIYMIGTVFGATITNNTFRNTTVQPLQIYSVSGVVMQNFKL